MQGTGSRGSKRRLRAAAAAAACAAVVCGAWAAAPRAEVVEHAEGAQAQGTAAEGAQAAEAADEGSAGAGRDPVAVHVDGAVGSPGVYLLEGEGPRVLDAVEAAGGLGTDADTSAINLAARVEDGAKVHVPAVGEQPPAAAGTDGASGGDDGTVNVNTADVQGLCALPGVGEATAAAIVEEREANGPFESPDDLVRVPGIGEKKLARMRERVRV